MSAEEKRNGITRRGTRIAVVLFPSVVLHDNPLRGRKMFFLNRVSFTRNRFLRGDRRARPPDSASVIRQPSVLRQLMNRV